MTKEAIRDEIDRRLAAVEANEEGYYFINQAALATEIVQRFPNVVSKEEAFNFIRQKCFELGIGDRPGL